jgi:NADPH:quinone reductase
MGDMRAIVYTRTGDPDVLHLTKRPVPEPGPDEVRVRVRVSGVNPTDWKSRRRGGSGQPTAFPEMVPNQDGAGVVDAVGPGVPDSRVGERVWLWEAAWRRADGTAQEYVVLPARQAVPLPDGASFDLGASLGIPALTAHRCLTLAPDGPRRLGPGALSGRTVLVAGGAGAVGNAAIQLARWAGATVVTTVSSVEKAALATAAGADHVVNYRTGDAAAAIGEVAPAGVDIIVEVAPAANAALDAAVAALGATVTVYAIEETGDPALPAFPLMTKNIGYQFLLVYTVPAAAKDAAVADVAAAVAAGALRVGDEAGLPLHRYPLAETGAAHAAVESGVVGKVLIDID